MINNKILLIAGLVILVIGGGIFFVTRTGSMGDKSQTVPTPTPAVIEQLTEDKQPQVSLKFTADGHYVTVMITSVNAANIEYNLIYDATVRKSPVNTGVSGSAKLEGQDSYSYKQLLGSESSGKFTYHENIKNAVMELTLRDSAGYSIFNATYPFDVTPGEEITLSKSD